MPRTPARSSTRTHGAPPKLLLAASILAVAGLPLSLAHAQNAPQQPAQPAANSHPARIGPATPAEKPKDALRFNFKDAPIDQVLDFFARESGVPIIFEAPPPQGTITFVSSATYSFDDALSIFNLNLMRFEVHLRHEGQYLYLATLKDSVKKPNVVVNPGNLPNIKPDQIITAPIPLENAKADLVAEQIKSMLSQFGGVVAVPAQNMVIVVENAAQVRRIREVISAIDAVKPVDSAFRLFPLAHAQADGVLSALKGLVGERTKTVIVDKDGQQRVVQDLAVQGLSLVGDPRTNSIIAVGPAARIRTVEELIKLLDVPGNPVAGGVESQMTTFTLSAVTPEEAAKQLNALYATVDPKQKPIVLPLSGANKVTVVGSRDHVSRASVLLSELDSGVIPDPQNPGMTRPGVPFHRAATISLKFAAPATIEGLLTRLLTQKQMQTVKFASAPDSRSIVISGMDQDVTWLESLVRALDVAPDADKDVRMVRVAKGDPAGVLAKATTLYQQTGRAEKDAVTTALDADSRTITLIGTKGALTTFQQLLTTAEQSAAVDQEVRRFTLTRAIPSVLSAKVARLSRPLLTPTDGAAYVEPTFEPADDISTLIVRAQPQQFEALAGLIQQLDSQTPLERSLRIVPVATEKAAQVKDKALAIYQAQAASLPNAQPIDVTVNEQANSLMVIADAEGMARFTRILDELQKQAGPAREVRLIELKLAKASEVTDFLRGMVKSSESMMIKGGPEPVFETVDATNSIMVAAQPAQFAVIESLVRGLDARHSADRPPMRILRLRSTDAANLASMLQTSFDQRPIEERTKKPVTIQADPGTNTLIVNAADEVMPEIESVIAKLNEQVTDDAGREIRIFPLKVARADELARTIDQMYPQPPVPLDPRTRAPRPDLQPPKEVTVRADIGTNALIVDAPAKRLAGFEALVRSLDQQKLGESVTLRTYKVERADLNSVATTIRNLAVSGSFSTNGPLNAPVAVSTENSTRTLIVSGPPAIFEKLEETLKTLDAAPALPATEMKLYALEKARSERLQPLVERILTQKARELDPALVNTSTRVVEVTGDAPSNTLIVNAPRNVIAIADGLVKALDQQAAATAVEVRVFRLGKGVSTTVGPAVASAIQAQAVPGEPAVSVTPEAVSNTLVIVGTSAQLEKAAKLIEEMDTTADKDGVGVKTITLRNARAESLAPVLESVLRKESALDKLPEWARMQAIARGATDGPQVRVIAEPALNSLIVSGPRNVIEVAEQVVAELDIDPAQRAGERGVRVITLQNSDAATLAQNLQAVFAEETSKDPAPTIRVDTQSNSLIVRATPAQMAQVDELTKKLDAAAVNGSRQMRMVSVDRSRVDAELLATTLKRMLEQQGAGVKVEVISAEELLKQNGNGKKSTHADPADRGSRSQGLSNSSTWVPRRSAAAPAGAPNAAWFAILATTIGAQPETPATTPTAATPDKPASAAPAQPEDEDTGITIAVDKASNSIMLVGSPRLTDRLATLAAQLQQQMPAEPTGVHVISLPTTTDLDALANLLRTTTQQIGRLSLTNPGGFSGPVNILPDPAGAALIVLCNDTDFATVGKLVATLAGNTAASATTVKVYPLTNTSPQKAITSLRDLFSANPSSRQAQRIRALDITVPGASGPVTSRINPDSIRMTPDPGGTSVIVAAPQEAFTLIDSLIETLDQSPVKDRLAIRRYELKNARATQLSQTLQQLFDAQRQGPGAQDLPQARFVADDRTNSILVTASSPQHQDVLRLLETADASQDQEGLELAIITLQQASASTVQRIVDEVVVGRDPAKRDRIRISAQDGSSLLVVRAPKDDVAAVKSIVAQLDTAETSGLPVKSIKLERADAATVAQALQKFFQDRAQVSSRPGVRAPNRVAVVGDKRTGTLIVSASDEDFATVQSLVQTFDTPSPAQDFQFKVVPLKHARVSDVSTLIKNVVDEMRWESAVSGRGGDQDRALYVQTNEATNGIVLVGRGDAIAQAERVIATLDTPPEQRAATVMRSVVVKSADVQALRTVLQKAFATPNWSMWRGQDPAAITVEVDKSRRALILLGKQERVEQALAYVKELDTGPETGGHKIESITLNHAQAARVSQSLKQFFADRARNQGVEPSVSIVGSQDGNVLIASGPDEDIRTFKDMVAQIDQPDGGKDRRIEVFVLKNGIARDTADALRSMFARAQRADEQVIITPQPSTNSLIISAPAAIYDNVVALLQQLDAAPKGDETNIETVALTTARASEVAGSLTRALPPHVKVIITPVNRSNSLLLTGSKEAIAIVMEEIKKLDTQPVRTGLTFRRFRIANADATDVAWTVEKMLEARPKNPTDGDASIDYSRQDNTVTVYAPADQVEEIEKIVRELDQPAGEERSTEFIKLQFAKAEGAATALKNFYGRSAPEASTPGARSVTIISDPVSNSLVIRADKDQWPGIRALIEKFDTKDYDTARQLAVIPLEHADAASVARALNDGLRAPLEEQLRQAQARAQQNQRNQGNNNQRPQFNEPALLITAEGLPTVSAEPMTNAVIVFASKPDLERIQTIVKQLDTAGFESMPLPRIIPLKSGKPSAIASNIRELYLNKQPNQRSQGPKSVIVIGDDTSGALIVRADDEKFAQIKALAETLEQQGQIGRVVPHVVALKNVAAGRLRTTLLATFTETAKSQGETLAVEVDRTSNSLVIACSPRLLEEIKRVIAELDAANLPAADPAKPDASPLSAAFTIIDINNNAPADLKKVLDDMGLTKPQNPDQRGLVSEQVTIVPLSSRRALAVLASPADARAVESLVRALDAEPVDAQQQLAVIPLKMASAKPLADTLSAMLKPTDPASQQGQTGPARALAEQVRRLALTKNGVNPNPATIDLSKPIRIIPDVDSNALIIASTQANLDAMREAVKLLDTLPVGDAVLVRIFMLENASAPRVKAVIDQLFAQGEALRRLPGTRRQGLPPTTTGQALAGEIAVSVDERTNAMVVAGREEAVALVEVLVKDLDSDRASKWIEPLIIPLQHADAATMARNLNNILVRGLAATPEAVGMQKQWGRLRMLAEKQAAAHAPAQPNAQPNGQPALAPQVAAADWVQADLFAPLNGLSITADETLNILIVVGSPANNQIVRQLVGMLDVEAASAANTVRVYPLKHAATERVLGVVRDIFRQRESSPDQRPEDRLIVSADARTNSLIASSSNKTFAILEGLLKTLDTEQTNFSVGLHVVPVTAGDVRQLAPRIDRLMRDRIQAAARVGSVTSPLDAFSIEPEPISNLLIVACSNENLQVVKELVNALAEGADRIAKGERMDIIQLTRSRAAEIIPSLNSLYIDKEVAKRGQGAVSATPNERLNAVVLSGTEQDLIELRALVNKLDTAEVLARQQIKWIELKSASAPEVVRLLQSVLAGRPLSGTQGRQAMKVQFLRDRLVDTLSRPGYKPTEADIDGAIKDQVTLNADQRTNSIWITAPEPIVALLTEMIEDIEASSAGARKIEYFKLLNADARQMAEVLRDTFNLRQQGNSLVLVPLGQQPTTPTDPNAPIDPNAQPPVGGVPSGPSGPIGIGDTAVTVTEDERQQLSIAVDARTNTLIVSGTADYIELVKKLVTELDSIEANERERRVYSLRNAKAKEIETTLKSYFSDESNAQRATLGPQLSGSLVRRLEEEVTVVGDEKSNKLVISTSPRYMNTVLSIIDELDASPPQVMIQVLLAEITLDNTDTWGMDVQVGPFGGEGYRIGSTPAGASVATALGVPNLSVSSADFGILIRSLEEQGKLEVLSNPQVMVSNNQTAKIQVGENIAVVNGVDRSSTGSSFANVERQDVGIILNVVPTINSDGFVRMAIQPEISQVSGKVTQISSDVSTPIIRKSAVDTIVNVKDGQSVVIGGLIQTAEDQRRTNVPGLGDIPIIGIPFRTRKDSNVKTELMVILTPRVIPGEAGMAEALVHDVTEQSIDRLEDPSKIQDYLERIRLEVKQKRAKEAEMLEEEMYNTGEPTSASAPATSPGALGEDTNPPRRDPSVLIPTGKSHPRTNDRANSPNSHENRPQP
ncbi:MAG TPA: secretin N-terminal domain-containing protein [Phycisphaerales bacterium]|nr:secretin N-terminal domain-containing protein [Phycisphaerales bacterium]